MINENNNPEEQPAPSSRNDVNNILKGMRKVVKSRRNSYSKQIAGPSVSFMVTKEKKHEHLNNHRLTIQFNEAACQSIKMINDNRGKIFATIFEDESKILLQLELTENGYKICDIKTKSGIDGAKMQVTCTGFRSPLFRQYVRKLTPRVEQITEDLLVIALPPLPSAP